MSSTFERGKFYAEKYKVLDKRFAFEVSVTSKPNLFAYIDIVFFGLGVTVQYGGS